MAIDESLFSYKPKLLLYIIVFNLQYGRGRRADEPVLVFGTYDSVNPDL